MRGLGEDGLIALACAEMPMRVSVQDLKRLERYGLAAYAAKGTEHPIWRRTEKGDRALRAALAAADSEVRNA